MKKITKWTANDIPDQTGRVAIVTGSNTGLGFEVALELAARGAHVIMAVRSVERGSAARDRIIEQHPNATITVQELDLSSLESVHTAARNIMAKFPHIDMLVNNAGSITSKGQKTKEGYEILFGTNHLGHFAFTMHLLKHMEQTPASRIVNVASVVHRKMKPHWLKMDMTDTSLRSMQAYSRSKFCNLLFTYELQRWLRGTDTICVAAHPGLANSDITRNFPRFVRFLAKFVMAKTKMGALPILRAATDPSVLGGQYYGPHGRREHRGYPVVVCSTNMSYDIQLQRDLWKLSEKLTGFGHSDF
ncbi:MAG: oxidoreductase [Firmicutes bacterium]|nr:oxidoreductase [Bacillota bacterium]